MDGFEIAAPNRLILLRLDSDFPWIELILSTPSKPACILSLVPVAWGGRMAMRPCGDGNEVRTGTGGGLKTGAVRGRSQTARPSRVDTG